MTGLQFAGEIRFYECRACGKLVVEDRARKVRLVDERGRPVEVVRVCESCFESLVGGDV